MKYTSIKCRGGTGRGGRDRGGCNSRENKKKTRVPVLLLEYRFTPERPIILARLLLQ